jgi:hypothetical protein
MAAVISLASLASCGSSARPVFHASDPSFRPAPGARPPVYLPLDLADVPRVQMRSVGIIEVTVPARGGLEAAAELAAAKGRELGCWIVVEHGAFARLQARASLAFGARVLLAHGGGSHLPHAAPPARQTAQFDCVLQAAHRALAAAGHGIGSTVYPSSYCVPCGNVTSA